MLRKEKGHVRARCVLQNTEDTPRLQVIDGEVKPSCTGRRRQRDWGAGEQSLHAPTSQLRMPG